MLRFLLAMMVLCGVAWVGPLAGGALPWKDLGDGAGRDRAGGVMVWSNELKQAIWVGPAEKGQNAVRLFDPQKKTWSDIGGAAPTKAFHPYYQTVLDEKNAGLYCLSGGDVLYRFDLKQQTWETLPPAPELALLSWHVLACDSERGKIVVVGADKRADNLGWSRTAVFDIATRKWSLLWPAAAQRESHQRRLATREALADLVGYTRLAWYRDPAGRGTEQQRLDLLKRVDEVSRDAAPAAAHRELRAAIEKGELLAALRLARHWLREWEEKMEQAFPVPCSRRNSPLIFDARSKLFVLFGGDHEDYLMNDTWVLDLEKGWKRQRPPVAPSPRAGHAMLALPGGDVLLYEGYVQTTSTDYSSRTFSTLAPAQIWRYDVVADRWELVGSWDWPRKESDPGPPPAGHFYEYYCQYFAPASLAVIQDQLLLHAQPGRTWNLNWKNFPSRMWSVDLSHLKPDSASAEQLGSAPNQRLSRGGMFSAEFCEVDGPPRPIDLANLPANQWVRLPAPPRNPLQGCRQRDWGTVVYDSDREQILHWGGGHCVRSASTVAHFSPVSGRVVEGFDADEPYNSSGSGGFDSSIWNRPWVGVHNYNHYCYDTKSKLLVSGRGYLYDPGRMDWLRIQRIPLPYEFRWESTVLEGSAHGAVAWARRKNSESAGLWLFDQQQGWRELPLAEKLFLPYCDTNGMTYDPKRDRMILGGLKPRDGKGTTGQFLAYDFKSGATQVINPDNLQLAKVKNARELAYVEHEDWIIMGEILRVGDPKKGKAFTRVYDCAAGKMFLLDAGDVGDGHGYGVMYDPARKLVYIYSYRGEAWAIRLEGKTATRLETP